MSSARELLAQGHAKRADLLKVLASHIHVEPGFNVPETKEEWEARVEAMVLHLAEGGMLPPVETRPREKGGQWLVDGHARHEAYKRAHKRGVPVADPKDGQLYLLTIPFVGNDADRLVRTITSAEGRTLTPLQLANRYSLLAKLGWKAEDIAKKVGKTGEHVRNVLKLADADTEVQQLVATGKVSASEAIKVVKKHGGEAKAVLQKAVKTAAKTGKKKATAKTLGTGKTEKQQALEMDAAFFRWLEQHGEVGVDVMGRFEIILDIDGAFENLRDAVSAGLVQTESEAAE